VNPPKQDVEFQTFEDCNFYDNGEQVHHYEMDYLSCQTMERHTLVDFMGQDRKPAHVECLLHTQNSQPVRNVRRKRIL
jgi:hypothetical protein